MAACFSDTPLSTPEPGFRWPVRVYYEDTDAGGVVYHAGYVRFFERARTERMRAAGFELDALEREQGLLFVVRAMNLDFLKPARFNDALQVTAEIAGARAASMTFDQHVLRGETDILCTARVRIVSVSARTLKPVAVPKDILEALVSPLA